jgi:hypothetical protein
LGPDGIVNVEASSSEYKKIEFREKNGFIVNTPKKVYKSVKGRGTIRGSADVLAFK